MKKKTYKDKCEDIHSSDLEMINVFIDVLRMVGYNISFIRYMEKELVKRYSRSLNASRCRVCNRSRYEVSIKHYANHVPKVRHCIDHDSTYNGDQFVPKHTFEEAWHNLVQSKNSQDG